ncbi:unnamed protein product [Allacma fusca]|uniref:C2H2-type domain-containing protein n=1 Tax=Allacma fusca TaxID=39272 RepID=A0A8J2JXH3_9HEXA|nr:unnamed protein product [Allacma fusca]
MKPKGGEKSEDEDQYNNKNNNYFGCAFCNYSSDKSANLNRHVRSMHETVKDSLICCGMQFKSKSDYRDHNKIKHKEGHLCTVCAKSFSRRALLKRHQSVHTGIKDFKCDYCTYSSSHKSNVVRHLKIHRDIIGVIQPRRYFQPEPDSTTSMNVLMKSPKTTQSMKTGNNVERIGTAGDDESKPSHILLSMLKSSKDEEQGTKKIKHSIDSILKKSWNEGSISIDKETHGTEPVSSTWVDERCCTQEGTHFEEHMKHIPDCSNDGTGDSSSDKEINVESLPPPIVDSTLIPENVMNEPNYLAFPTSTYLPVMDFSTLTGTNWTLPFGPVTPYSYYPTQPGFGSVIGLEESRFLSSPHSQSSLGLPLTSAFVRPYERWRARDFARMAPFPSPHLFTSPAPSSATSSIPHEGSSSSTGANYTDSSGLGSCLTFTQVSNSKVTHFVTY